jgi:chorismate mutase/prephenate dehydratase
LPVQHCLLANCPRAQIKKLYAHPQALGQCRTWVQTNLPRVEIIETSSNARSAELAAKEKGAAAIAGILASERYDVPVLDYDIQDNVANATRFLVLGRQCSPPPATTAPASCSASMDRVGALYHALAAFRRYRINMTKIESRPSKRKAWEYFFFVDCEGHMEDRRWARPSRSWASTAATSKCSGLIPIRTEHPRIPGLKPTVLPDILSL